MKATASSEHPNVGSEGLASFAIDGKEGTIWHTNYTNKVELPQHITLDLGGSYTLNKFTYLPRQSGTNGNITQYEIQVSTNGTDFTKVAEGNWENNSNIKAVKFETPVEATHLRLVAKAGIGGFASAAELNVHKVKDETQVPEVDKKALKITIDYADELVAEGALEGVVPVVVNEFNKALVEAKAVYENKEATETEVDAAFKRLVNVIWMLEFKQGNKDALETLVNSAKALVENEYTSDSWTKLQTEIAVAETVIADENAMQEEVDEIFNTLKNAIDALVKKNINKSDLESYVNSIEGLSKDEYIKDTWNNFEKALDAAKKVLVNEEATQEDVDSAYNNLVRAHLGLRLTPDKSKLEDLINKIKDMDLSKYTKESVANINKELKNANKVLKDKNSTQEEVEAVTRTLNLALASLEEKDNENNNNSGNNNGNNNSSGNNNSGNNKPNSNTGKGDKLPSTGSIISSTIVLLLGVAAVVIGGIIVKKREENKKDK